MSKSLQLSLSGLVLALYLVLMWGTQNFAFGQYQLRLATALYALAAPFPFLVLPLALANLLSNVLLGGLGPLDMVGGFAVGLATCGAIAWTRGWGLWRVCLFITLIPGLGVPLWLSPLLGLPYLVLVPPLLLSQAFCGLAGLALVAVLRRWGLTDLTHLRR